MKLALQVILDELKEEKAYLDGFIFGLSGCMNKRFVDGVSACNNDEARKQFMRNHHVEYTPLFQRFGFNFKDPEI